MNQFNEKYQRHGYWEIYFFDGRLLYKGDYVNGKQDGYWEWYDYNILIEKEFNL